MPEDVRIDWDRPTGTPRPHGCRFPGCVNETEAHVQIMVRRKAPGKGNQGQVVASKQHGYCRAHAEDVFARMFAELERG